MRKVGLLLASVVIPLLLASGVALVAAINSARSQAIPVERPNIVLILTDDQDVRSLAQMPQVRRKLIDRGMTFKNGFVTDPLCCPSRASILRGQYVHNHGVKGNTEPSGHDAFRDLGRENSTIATWLDDGGYRTALIGKYMNAYDQLYVPPGWDYWFAGYGKGSYRKFNDNGTLVDYANKSPSTDILANKLYAYLEATRDSSRPFFLYLATHDPHRPATPSARYRGKFADTRLPKPPNFNERDVSDKPGWVRRRPLLSDRKVRKMQSFYRKRLESLQAVDEMVGKLVDVLADQGKLRNTYIFYTSDTGYHQGLHRLSNGKTTAYEEDIKVPYIVRGPGVPAGRTLDHLVLNNDLAPTFARLGGVSAPSFVDGRSLLPLLDSTPRSSREWRSRFLVENYFPEHNAPDYHAVRTKKHIFISNANGERELYNLRNDPYELKSIHRTARGALLSDLNSKLNTLKTCASFSCRTAEGG